MFIAATPLTSGSVRRSGEYIRDHGSSGFPLLQTKLIKGVALVSIDIPLLRSENLRILRFLFQQGTQILIQGVVFVENRRTRAY
jgi:hypothetical protein